MNIIMDRFNKTNQTYIGKLVKKLLLVSCLGILTSFSYAGGPCDPNDDMFACGLPNAIPVSIHYRQINFPSNTKVTITYIPNTSWGNGKSPVASCISNTTHKDVTDGYDHLVTDMTKFGGKDNYYCVKGLVANRTQSTTTDPIQIGADGLGIPDAILDNMQNPEENKANSYLFNILSMDSSNDLLGSETGKKDINLYYMNALFYNNSTDSSVQPVRWIPGHKG
ncbi:MAG: hypothetical protein HOI53_04420, partial [Francisellaceae bacterium]|nr:hypothetical protein [Francisellaceae bacterium]